MKQFRKSMVVMAIMLMVGCSSKPANPPHFKTRHVTGIVKVDGKPVERVKVTFNPVGDSSSIKFPIETSTDREGMFAAATYARGDGLPEGTYNLTFSWYPAADPAKDGPFRKKEGAERLGVDKLKKAYSDPADSKHKVTVKDEAVDLGVIELSSE